MKALVQSPRAPAPDGGRPAPCPAALSRLVADWVARLERAGLDHVVLRGHAAYPRLGERSDLDLVAREGDLALLEAELEGACRRHGARVYERFRAGHLHQYYLFLRADRAFFEIDVHTAEACYGVPYLSADEVLRGARLEGGLRRAGPATEAVCNFLAPLLSGCPVEERYRAPLLEAAVLEPGALQETFRTLFGARCGGRLLASAVDEPDALGAEARRGRRALLARCFLRRPLASLAGFLRFGWGVRARPWLFPRGRFAAFLGTDGAGKSALAEAVRDRLAHVFRGGTARVWHWRPGLLPQINTLVHLGRTTYTAADMQRPHRARPSGRVGSALRLVYYWLDYVLGYALRVLPHRRRHSLVLFDRYFHDCLVDPGRSRVRSSGRLAGFLARHVPRPDATFVVIAPVAVVQQRKQELPPEESARQLAAYAALARTRARFHVIENDGPLEEVVGRVLEVLFGPEGDP